MLLIREYDNNSCLSASDLPAKPPMYFTPHAQERWKERFNNDLEAMCYRGLNARRVPSREARKFRACNQVLATVERGCEFYEHGSAMFVINPTKRVVVTVLPADYIK